MILGIGCDICKLSRFEKKQEQLAQKILTERERACYEKLSEKRKLEYIAGRFSAKEAIFKAINTKTLVLSQIEVLNNQEGKPFCLLPNVKVHVSIAHEEEYAIAYAMCESIEE